MNLEAPEICQKEFQNDLSLNDQEKSPRPHEESQKSQNRVHIFHKTPRISNDTRKIDCNSQNNLHACMNLLTTALWLLLGYSHAVYLLSFNFIHRRIS